MFNLGGTETAAGKLVLQIIGAVAEFERTLVIERQKDRQGACRG